MVQIFICLPSGSDVHVILADKICSKSEFGYFKHQMANKPSRLGISVLYKGSPFHTYWAVKAVLQTTRTKRGFSVANLGTVDREFSPLIFRQLLRQWKLNTQIFFFLWWMIRARATRWKLNAQTFLTWKKPMQNFPIYSMCVCMCVYMYRRSGIFRVKNNSHEKCSC